jgi:hypothetical protein
MKENLKKKKKIMCVRNVVGSCVNPGATFERIFFSFRCWEEEEFFVYHFLLFLPFG